MVSFQYFRSTGSIVALSNSSVMHWTSSEVLWDFLPVVAIDTSDRDKKVSGTRIKEGLWIWIWWRVFTYVGQSASCKWKNLSAYMHWKALHYLNERHPASILIKRCHPHLTRDTATFKHGNNIAAFISWRSGGLRSCCRWARIWSPWTCTCGWSRGRGIRSRSGHMLWSNTKD